MGLLLSTLKKHASASAATSAAEYDPTVPAKSKLADRSQKWEFVGRRRYADGGPESGVNVYKFGDKLGIKQGDRFVERHAAEFSPTRFAFRSSDGKGWVDSHNVSYNDGQIVQGGANWWRRNVANPARNVSTWFQGKAREAVQGIRDPNWGWASKIPWGESSKRYTPSADGGTSVQTNAYDSEAALNAMYRDMITKNSSYTLQPVRVDGSLTKSASEADAGLIKKCDEILKKIYEENPDYWPWGLSRQMFECTPGSELHLVLDKKASTPVGFVGWYERPVGLRKVGYYSIGVLPEHRNSGFAKEAVQKMVACRADGVDEVRAMIRVGNEPSKALARVLNIPVEAI